MVADLLMHRGEGDTPISEIAREPLGERVNLADVVDGAAFSVLERAVDRSVIMKNSFLLELTNRLFDLPRSRMAFGGWM